MADVTLELDRQANIVTECSLSSLVSENSKFSQL